MTDADELKERASALMRADDYRAARELLSANNALVSTHYPLAWNMGWACFKLEEFNEACDWLRRAVTLRPAHAAGRWALGEAYSALDQFDAAELEFLRSIALKDSYQARQALGFLYHRCGRLDEADAVYREGIRLKPQDAERCEAFADFLSDIGREDEAKEYYERGAKIREAGGEPPRSASEATEPKP